MLSLIPTLCKHGNSQHICVHAFLSQAFPRTHPALQTCRENEWKWGVPFVNVCQGDFRKWGIACRKPSANMFSRAVLSIEQKANVSEKLPPSTTRRPVKIWTRFVPSRIVGRLLYKGHQPWNVPAALCIWNNVDINQRDLLHLAGMKLSQLSSEDLDTPRVVESWARPQAPLHCTTTITIIIIIIYHSSSSLP